MVTKIFCLIYIICWTLASFLKSNECFTNEAFSQQNFKEINAVINETIQLECSLESQIDHVIWKRKMSGDVQILTINEYNFISNIFLLLGISEEALKKFDDY